MIELLEAAAGDGPAAVAGLKDLLYVEIVRLVRVGDYNHMHLAALAQAMLKAAIAEQKLAASESAAAEDALANVLADVLGLEGAG